jgi:cytosine deaminase
MRGHVDIDANNLVALEALLDLRERLKGVLTLQLVALGNPGLNQAETAAMRRALELGTDLVGGAPALLPNPRQSLDTAFDLAESSGKDLDLHIDESEDPNLLTLEYLAEQTIKRGFVGHVTAGHCCSLDFLDNEAAKRVMDKVAEAQINIVTLPSCNLALMGRDRHPVPRGLTRVKELLARGVRVAAASDNVQDPFNPFGHYDPLFIANLTAHAAHLTAKEELTAALELVTNQAAKVMRLPNYGLYAGAEADLVILNTTQVPKAVTELPERLATFKGGRLILKQSHEQQWSKEFYGSDLA